MTPSKPNEKAPNVPGVGPVLTANALGYLVAGAIEAQNVGVTIVNRGAYLRVLAPGYCRLELAALEASLEPSMDLPAVLEQVMPSFQGRLRWSDGVVEWT